MLEKDIQHAISHYRLLRGTTQLRKENEYKRYYILVAAVVTVVVLGVVDVVVVTPRPNANTEINNYNISNIVKTFFFCI